MALKSPCDMISVTSAVRAVAVALAALFRRQAIRRIRIGALRPTMLMSMFWIRLCVFTLLKPKLMPEEELPSKNSAPSGVTYQVWAGRAAAKRTAPRRWIRMAPRLRKEFLGMESGS